MKLLVVIDEFTRESLAIDINRKIKGSDVVEVLRYLFAVRGAPDFIRSGNGPEFVSEVVKKFLRNYDVDTLYIEPGSPRGNGYVESFNSKIRDELLNRELFLHIDELRYIANRWRMDYNHYRISSESRQRFADFMQIWTRYGGNRRAAFGELMKNHRNSYYFYYSYGPFGVKK